MTDQIQELINSYPTSTLCVVPIKYNDRVDLLSLSIPANFSDIPYMQLFDAEDKLLALFNLIE